MREMLSLRIALNGDFRLFLYCDLVTATVEILIHTSKLSRATTTWLPVMKELDVYKMFAIQKVARSYFLCRSVRLLLGDSYIKLLP